MNFKRRYFVLFWILLISVLLGADYLCSHNIIKAKEYGIDRTTAKQENIKTDIAQMFIETNQTVTKEHYSAAKIVIIDAKGGSCKKIVDNDAKIKIRGNSTADLRKLPFNIKLSSAQSVLGMSEGKKWCLLANYMDTSLMRDKLAYDFAANIGLKYSCESRYADIWLNGKLQGNYLITVPVETGTNRVDINTDNNEYLLELEDNRREENTTYFHTGFCRFKIDAPKTLTEEQYNWLVNYFAKVESSILNETYSEIDRYVDVDSFINYYITEELFKNLDVHTSSARFYITNNKLYAGPLWDMDLSSGNVALYHNYSYYLVYNNFGKFGNSSGNSFEGFWALNGGPAQNYYDSWIGNLMRCKQFRNKLYARYQNLQDQIVNLYEDNTIGKNQMDLLLDQYGESFSRDNKLWPVENYRNTELYRTNEKSFEKSVSFLRSWLKCRNEWLLKALAQLETDNQKQGVCNLRTDGIVNGGSVTWFTEQLG